MRHFFKFIPASKRAEAKRLYDDTAAPSKAAPVSSAARKQAEKTKNQEVQNKSRQTPKPAAEASGPEFGGLIERRGVDQRGLMPKAYKKEVAQQEKPRSDSELGKNPKFVNIKSQPDEEISPESTGVFLSALDNSSITLADSGLFKIENDDDEEPKESFNPYDRS